MNRSTPGLPVHHQLPKEGLGRMPPNLWNFMAAHCRERVIGQAAAVRLSRPTPLLSCSWDHLWHCAHTSRCGPCKHPLKRSCSWGEAGRGTLSSVELLSLSLLLSAVRAKHSYLAASNKYVCHSYRSCLPPASLLAPCLPWVKGTVRNSKTHTNQNHNNPDKYSSLVKPPPKHVSSITAQQRFAALSPGAPDYFLLDVSTGEFCFSWRLFLPK